MMYKLDFTVQAKADIALHKKSNPAAYSKVEKLLGELRKHPRYGIGKPKPLSSNRAGQWSRRITDKHRLVYEIDDNKIIVLVLTAAGHYDD
ncbi:Txe/YoeB family addiction module toxin [Bacteroidia bacterium]|nr:Txe/YoeB family addiction module toxin [Bacteroidia bacterium]